ncbi:MAG: hypothetical protein JHC84_20340 [Solirubrobacteraceae bacterium]|nr:hypothetical protein [Solirubrobacteraceae bacterium]
MGSLSRLLLGGYVPDALRAELDAEAVLILAEDCPGTLTYRNFRSPRRRASLKKQGIRAAVVVTSRRVVICRRSGPLLDVPFDDPRFAALEWEEDRPDRFCVGFDVAVFHDDWSGRWEIRLTTDRTPEILARVRS